jgi:hypothetical protein
MAAKKKCLYCGFRAYEMIKVNVGSFCNAGHAIKWARKKADKDRLKAAKKVEREVDKAYKQKNKEDKLRIKKRSAWYDDYKIVLHYHVKHILRKGEPCYTCGKSQSFSDSGGAFHVGHFMPAKQVDPRRFMLENLRIQCYSCNAMKSGNQGEYRKRMTEEMGIDHVEWLECEVNHKGLKEVFPHYQDIQVEIARYRKLNKLTPAP